MSAPGSVPEQRELAHAGHAVAALYRDAPGFSEVHGDGWWQVVSGEANPEHNWLAIVSAAGLEPGLASLADLKNRSQPALVYVASDLIPASLLEGIGLVHTGLLPHLHLDLERAELPVPGSQWRYSVVSSVGRQFAAAMRIIGGAFDDDPTFAARCLRPALLQETGVRILIAEDDDGVASAAMAHRDADLLYIVIMATDPARQRHGAGTALIATMLGDARKEGIRRCHLVSSEAGRRLYARFGFDLGSDGELWMLPGTSAAH